MWLSGIRALPAGPSEWFSDVSSYDPSYDPIPSPPQKAYKPRKALIPPFAIISSP